MHYQIAMKERAMSNRSFNIGLIIDEFEILNIKFAHTLTKKSAEIQDCKRKTE